MPYVPVVSIAEVLILRIDEATERYGRCMDIRDLGAYFLFNIGNDALEELYVNGDTDLVYLGCRAGAARLDLVVAADDSKASVMAYSLKILANLDDDVVKHTLVGKNVGTSEGEVEEYYKTELVADIEEIVVGIVAAAPYSDSVEVGEGASLKELA